MKLCTEFKEATTWRHTHAAAVTADDIVDLGDIYGIAVNTYAASVEGLYCVKGTKILNKDATLTIAEGDKLYYDAANSVVTNIPLGRYIGVAVVSAASTDATVEVSLNDPIGFVEGPSDLCMYQDDFIALGANIMSPATVTETNRNGWSVVDVGDATEAAVSNEPCGAMALTLAETSEAEDAVLYHGDQLSFDIDKLRTVEFRAAVVTPGTGVCAVMGMAGAHNLDKDTVAQNAWFRLDASLVLKVETDDGTTDNDDAATGITLTTATYYWFKIDFTNTSDVKFYVKTEGSTKYTRVASSTTFDMDQYTSGLQPYFSLDKASGTGTATITLDFIRIISER